MNTRNSILLHSAAAVVGALWPLPATQAAPKPKASKAAAKPAPKPAVRTTVMGMVPMAGVEAKLGQAYTLEDGNPINFTLKAAEFSLGRVTVGDRIVAPKKDEKLLVLRYTLHNPQKSERQLYWGTLNFTAVDASNQNREFEQLVGSQTTGQRLELDLKPAQKAEAYTILRVPAKGVVPKLIVKPRNGGVLRYDLRTGVKPLAAPFADASDASGASAPLNVAGQKDTFYALNELDVKLVGTAYADELGEAKAPEGQRFLVATFIMKNGTPSEKRYYWGTVKPELTDAEGEKPEWNQVMLKGSRNERAEGTLAPGEEYKARFYFALPKDVAAKSLTLSEDEAHPVTFDISAQ